MTQLEGLGQLTPERRPGSVRRTTTHDCTRPAGLDGPVTVVVSGRDLRTGPDRRAAVLGAARLEIEAEFGSGTVTGIVSEPPRSALEALIGASMYGGFRKAVSAAVPEDRTSRSVHFQILDDLPMAVMLSGRVLRSEGIALGDPDRSLPVDVCAGWVEGGTLLAGFNALGPPLNVGPPAPRPERDGDRLGWHDHDPLPPHATRRSRRLDVWEEGGLGQVEAYFRDSHADGDGVETIVHEYAVEATVDPATQTFVSCAAEPGTLPYPECPGAAASAGRLVGSPIDGIRRSVPTTLVGPTTCTHLNDTLRSLEDVGALLLTLEFA